VIINPVEAGVITGAEAEAEAEVEEKMTGESY